MDTSKINIYLSIIMIFFIVVISSCKKDEADTTDQDLYNMAKETNGFTWYKNSEDYLNKSIVSGHSFPFLRTRYNSIAAQYLDVNGKIAPGALFGEGSLIVKELYNVTYVIQRYAILYKNASNPNADANGWVWGYINADGTVAEPASNKGAGCISCHSETGNIDYMLMNEYFP